MELSHQPRAKIETHITRYCIPDKVITNQRPYGLPRENLGISMSCIRGSTQYPAHYHLTNGMAKAAVTQARKILKVSKMSGQNPFLALLDLRNTPEEELNTIPTQKLMRTI